jgi:thiamine biosynthesis lipoprotein
VIKLEARCLSTSGDYQTFFSDDFAHNHIFDPRKGYSPREFSSVSILAASGMEADALSTAVFVLGAERGLDLLKKRNADGFFTRKDGSTAMTAGFKDALCDD